jgi:hypothetical protein
MSVVAGCSLLDEVILGADCRVTFKGSRRSHHLSTIAHLMANISWTTYRCPQCKRVLDKHLGTSVGMRLGPEVIICPCGEIISSGTHEWASLNERDKRRYLLPTPDFVIVLIGILFAVYVSHFTILGVWIALGIVAIYALLPLNKLKAVRESKKRTDVRE